MPITIIAGQVERRGKSLWSRQSLSQSTATAFQALATTVDTIHAGAGTATGFGRNQYSLADGIEGQECMILTTGTGEAKILFTNGTATGQWVLTAQDSFVNVKFRSGKWRVVASNATVATST